jgi:hypothetical protein
VSRVLRNAVAGENAKQISATVKLHWYYTILNGTVAIPVAIRTKYIVVSCV